MTYQGLTQDEWDDPAENAMRVKFDKQIAIALGPEAKPEDFDFDLDLQEEFEDHYEDDNQPAEEVPDRDNLPDDHYDQYLGAEFLLPRGDKMLTVRVK